MLVLTRKPGEQLVIGNNIRVTIVSVGPGRVKIGIEAPPDVRIDRQEIHERILHEQEQATDVLANVTGLGDGAGRAHVHKVGGGGHGRLFPLHDGHPAQTPERAGLPHQFRDGTGQIDHGHALALIWARRAPGPLAA